MCAQLCSFTRPRYFVALRINSTSSHNTDNNRALSIEREQRQTQAKKGWPQSAIYANAAKMAAVTVDGTVVEEEKVDLEIPQEKVDVKKADEAEPEGRVAGGLLTAPATCEVNGYTWCGPSVASSSTPSMRPAPLAGRRTPTTSTRRAPLCRASSRRP